MFFQVEVARAALLGWVLLGSALSASARCTCSDVRPRFSHDGPPVPFGCFDQRRFGKCDEPFMFETIEELAEGYCQISCGRCDCCSTFKDLAMSLGLDEMLQMMKIGGMDPIEFQENPAWMASVLVPQPGAFAHWLDVQGWTKESVTTTSAQQSILKDTLMLHILPPVEPIIALWTTPFFLTGTQIPTSSPSFPFVHGFMDSASTGVSGDINSVTVVNGNQEFCKGFIHVVNDVILAYPLQVPPVSNENALGSNVTASPVEAAGSTNQTESIGSEVPVETNSLNNQTEINVASPPEEAAPTSDQPTTISPEAPAEANSTRTETETLDSSPPGEALATRAEAESLSPQPPAETNSTGGPIDTISPAAPAGANSSNNQPEAINPESLATTNSTEPMDDPEALGPKEGPAPATVGGSPPDPTNPGSGSNFLG